MTNATNMQELTANIECLVREQVAEIQRAVQRAVEQAFSSVAGKGTAATRSGGSRAMAPSAVVAPSRKRGATGKRRGSSEVAELGERLYRAVCEHPGESMGVLSGAVGASVRELHRPMTLLRRDGRVRSVGERHATRYFPMARASRQEQGQPD